MTFLTLCAGLMVYYVTQLQSENFLSRGLEHSLQVRVEDLIATLHSEVEETNTIATRPLLIAQLQKLNTNRTDADVLKIFERAAKTFLPEGFSAVAFYDVAGREIASAGTFTHHSDLEVTLNSPFRVKLSSDNGMLLHVDADMQAGGKKIGSVSTEARLPSINKLLLSEFSGLGKSGEVLLCAPLQTDMTCFQTRLTPHVIPKLARLRDGQPIPMSLALYGLSGVMTTLDYRSREVVAAYSPVDKLGLGMVLKIDTDELYQPIHRRLGLILALLLVLLLGGVLLLRWQVMPLVKRLVRSEREARVSYDNLLASDAHIRVLTEVSPVGIFRTNENGDCIYVNERYCEITGLPIQQVLGQSWIRALHPDDAKRVIDDWNNAVGEKLPFSCECRFRQPSGDVVWILVQTTRELNKSGKVKGYIGSITDITGRRKVEEALKMSEERYRSIVTVMAEGIIIQSADQSVIACNPSAERILGLSRSQIFVGGMEGLNWKTIREDGSPFQKDAYPAMVTLRTGKPKSNVIIGLYRSDGSLIWLSVNCQPLIRPGEMMPYAVVSSIADITEQHCSEEALKRNEARYRTIVELAQEGIWQINENNITTFVNKKMADILSCDVEDIQGHSIFEFMDNEGRKITEKRLERRRQGIMDDYEFEFIRKDGVKVWTLLSASPLFDDMGHYLGAFAMISDITEHKRWESALIQSEKNFRALIEDANVGILVHNQGRHEFANAKLLSMLGYTLEEFQATTMRDIVHPDEFEKVSSRYRARLEGREVPSVYDTVLQTKLGASIAVELTATKTVWEGRSVGLVLLHDISERQQAVEQRRSR